MRLKRNLYITILFASLIFLASCSPPPNRAQGYIEGRYTYMTTSVSGILKKILVARGSRVKQGDTLFELEQQPESDLYDAAVDNLTQAKASRDATLANLAYAKITFERYKVLVVKNAIEQSQLDNARSIYDATVAQLAQVGANINSLTATLAQAKWVKDQKSLTAPVDAIVFDTYYRIGEYTQANQAILSLLAPADIKAIFYVAEPALSGLKIRRQSNRAM